MAKIKDTTGGVKAKVKVSHPGVHSKTRTSKLKTYKNYRKLNRGQGR